MKKLIYILLLISSPILAQDIGGDYYVVPPNHSFSGMAQGSDAADGSFATPFATLQAAINVSVAGDTTYLRDGVWYPLLHTFANNTYEISPHDGSYLGNDGTAEAPICYFNYPGETPILDFDSVLIDGDFNTGINMLYANYQSFRGLTLRNLRQAPTVVPETGNPAMAFGAWYCSNIRYENLTIHNIGGRGFYHTGAFGYPFEDGGNWPTDADTSRWINCDIYDVNDSLSRVPGNAADGIKLTAYSAKQSTPRTYYHLKGIRIWNFTDDGIDMSGEGLVHFDSCWAFNGGTDISVDGNGFKYGFTTYDSGRVSVIVTNCVAAGNTGIGFSEHDFPPLDMSYSRIYNNFSYANGMGFAMRSPTDYDSSATAYRNNIAYGSTDLTPPGDPYDVNLLWPYKNSDNNWWFYDPRVIEGGSWPWTYPRYTVTDADFVSLDIEELKAPRKADNSLPDVDFGHLVAGSQFIDKGAQPPESDSTGLVFPYNGLALDIGAFEYGEAPDTVDVETITISAAGSATTIEVNDGTLQMSAAITPDTASFQDVTWSTHGGTGSGTVNVLGLVQAVSNGTDTIRATAQDGTGITDDYILTYSNQNDITIPTVTTSAPGGLYTFTVASGGNVTATGGASVTAKGVCWSTSENPTLSDAHTVDGSGTGAYTSTLTNLTPWVEYHIRSYATNSQGTAYGEDRPAEARFTTKPMKVSPSGSPIFRGGKVVTK